MDNDALGLDPSIAEAMGFSGFGMQTNKKRKHGSEDAFIDTHSISSGNKEAVMPTGGPERAIPGGKRPIHTPGESQPYATQNDADAKPTLEALRHGVKNADGDMVYFLPSFIEDPWKDLRPR